MSDVKPYGEVVCGTGRTSRQMSAAPKDAFFIWCNSRVDYAKALAYHLNRGDLHVRSPDWLSGERWHGMRITGIVLDHALILSTKELEAVHLIERLQYRP